MIDSVLIMRGLEEMYPELRFIERLRHCIETYPELNWGDAMSRGQITSKLWLLNQLEMNGCTDLGNVAVCGGWVGILPRLMFDSEKFKIKSIHSLDKSVLATIAAKELNQEYLLGDEFLASVEDCYNTNYNIPRYQTVINTSCEHFEDFNRWYGRIPNDTLVVLQSNNFREIEDHVDCVDSCDELAKKANFTETIYKGELPCIKYTRFMVIGVK